MGITPANRPEANRQGVLSFADDLPENGVFLVGRRGYYRDTMGKPGVNDRGLYDDAIFLLSDNAFAAFNANTDPSVWRKGIAVLQPGRYAYVVGTHNITKAKDRQYEALVQASGVDVLRDGATRPEKNVWIGINIHRGSRFNTSSEGCQTIHPDQWDAFLALVKSELIRAKQKYLPYFLTDRG